MKHQQIRAVEANPINSSVENRDCDIMGRHSCVRFTNDPFAAFTIVERMFSSQLRQKFMKRLKILL